MITALEIIFVVILCDFNVWFVSVVRFHLIWLFNARRCLVSVE